MAGFSANDTTLCLSHYVKDIADNRMLGKMDEPITEEVKGKRIAIPLQPWTVPEGSRWLRLQYFKTIGT